MDNSKKFLGMAACAALLGSNTGFISAPAPVETPASMAEAGQVALRGAAPQSAAPGISGATAGACGLVAAAGLVAANKRRGKVALGPKFLSEKEALGVNRQKPYKPMEPDAAGTHIAMAPTYPVMSGMVDLNSQLRIMPTSEKTLNQMVGFDVEMGDKAWDPMGFSKLFDRNFDFGMTMTYPHVQWLREAEVKHGRICMLAFVGMVVQQFYQWPGYPQEPDWTKALDACYAEKLPALGIAQISAFAFVVEGRYYPGEGWVGLLDREPGDLGFDPCKLSKRPGFNLKEKQLSELKNGRLAMIGVASLAANHAIPGSVPLLDGAF